MAQRRATDPDDNRTTPDKCDPDGAAGDTSGPVREAGGTTGAGNLSPGGASRTGGATTGVSGDDATVERSRALPPDA